jgi:hypothetical protein
MKALLVRKRDYEATAKAENVPFLRNAQDSKKRQIEKAEELDEAPRAKKARTRNRKKKEKRMQTGAVQPGEPAGANEDKAVVRSNVNIRCNRIEVPCTAVVDILDPDILDRKTPLGNPFRLPFQNCKYKTSVRVVDFFPDNIADFAAPRRDSDYTCLSDHEEDDEDSDIDLTQGQREDVRWEWCFYLLVEDAQPQSSYTGRPRQMELLVADTDGEFLLKMDACNLRDKENVQQLATLKEKLFHLWGDLQERKEECSTVEALSVKPNARPFECLIKEYGVRSQTSDGRPKDALTYDRRFRLFGTTI